MDAFAYARTVEAAHRSKCKRGKLLMASNKFNYYDAYCRQALFAEEMALNLSSAIKAGDLGQKDLMLALHTFENDADEVNHQIQERLLEDFMVPLGRSSMCELAHAMDNVSDAIEEISIQAYIRRVCRLPESAVQLVDLLADAVVSLREATQLLEDFHKQQSKLKTLCIRVQSLESEGDGCYIAAARALYDDESLADAERRTLHAMLDAIEAALDAAENAAECIEVIIAENI